MAHDFNNILTPIVGYTEMSLDSLPKRHEAREWLKVILNSCSRAQELVQQILTFSRKNETQFKVVDMKDVVDGGLKLIRSSLPSTIKLDINLKRVETTVFGDRTQLEQVLLNLCANAGYAMIPKGGTLSVSLEKIEPHETGELPNPALTQEQYIRLIIKDTGMGMTPKTLERLFEPFYTTKPVGEGTGLGLSVVHGIIEKHGGVIEVESEMEKGSQFAVYIPAIPPEDITIAEKEGEITGQGESILIVDDETLIVEMYRNFLERAGYRVNAQTNSLRTLEIFREQSQTFDLVITDNTMPNLDGVQLAKEMRIIRKDIPIILCTGNSSSLSMNTREPEHITKLLLKPVFLGTLSRAIREITNNRKTGIQD